MKSLFLLIFLTLSAPFGCSINAGKRPKVVVDSVNRRNDTLKGESHQVFGLIQQSAQLTDYVLSSVDNKILNKDAELKADLANPSNVFSLLAELLRDLGDEQVEIMGENDSEFILRLDSLQARSLSSNQSRVRFFIKGDTYKKTGVDERVYIIGAEILANNATKSYSFIKRNRSEESSAYVFDLQFLDLFYKDFSRYAKLHQRFSVNGKIYVHSESDKISVSSSEMKIVTSSLTMNVQEYLVEGSSLSLIDVVKFTSPIKWPVDGSAAAVHVSIRSYHEKFPVLSIDIEKKE